MSENKKVMKLWEQAFGKGNLMRKYLLINIFILGIGVLVFSCESLHSTESQGDSTPFSIQNNQNRRGDSDVANWDIATLDTAVNVNYLSPAEKDVILEMNKVRADPKKYAELYIRPRLRWFGGPFGEGSYLAPGETVYTSTQEGKNGIQSCIDDLSRRQSMQSLIPGKGLFLAARDHVKDTGSKGITGHTGSDGSSMGQRIDRYGKWGGGAGENISYGYNLGRDIVIQLLIDDGVSSRGHRNNILNGKFKYAGAAIGNHSEYTFMCVIDYANEYVSN
jgi:hypothetical protein